LLNARELAELGNAAVAEARKYYPDVAYNTAFAMPSRFGKGTDWQDEIFRVAPMTNYQLSLRGGSEKTSYYLSGNLVGQQGIIKNSDFNKGTFRLNLDNQLSNKVKTGININLSKSINDGVTTGVPNTLSNVVTMALLFNPGQNVYDPDQPGGYTYESNTINKVGNPVAEINETKTRITTTRVISDGYLDWKILKNLTYKFKFGIDAFFNKEQQYIPSFIKRGQEKGKGNNVNIDGYTWLIENTLTYDLNCKKIGLTFLLDRQPKKYVSESAEMAVERFNDDRLGYYDLGAAIDKTIITGYNSWSMLSGIARVIYNYDNKYYLTASGEWTAHQNSVL
jgi:hypothetical protein